MILAECLQTFKKNKKDRITSLKNKSYLNCSGRNLINYTIFFNLSELNPLQWPEEPTQHPNKVFMKYKFKGVHFLIKI